MGSNLFYNHRKFILILAVYLVLAVSYSIVVPIGRGADEWAHYWYAQFIADHGRLPANSAEREAAGYKSDWPPLYHFFAAGLTGWIETDGPPTFKYREDDIRRQLVPAQGPEAILHTEDELFPWQQEVLVWHLGRLLSILFSSGVLLVTYFIARDVFISVKIAGSGVSSQTLALVSVAVLAFNPRFIFTGMVFGYDSLTLLMATLFLWLAIRILKGHCFRWGFLGLGLLAGLALTTKYLAALLPLEILVVVLLSKPQSTSTLRWKLTRLGQAALAYFVTVVWWFGYLLVNFNEIATYGPVLGALAPLIRGDGSDRTVEELFAWLSGGQTPPPAYIEKQAYTVWQIIAELPITFWGNPVARPYSLNWFVVLMSLVTIAAIVGLVMWWRNSTSATKLSRHISILLIVHAALAIPFMVIRLFGARDALEAVQGRHLLFLSAPAIAILIVWGIASVRPQVSSAKQYFAFYVLLGLLLFGSVGQLIFMCQIYSPLLPVQTTLYTGVQSGSLPEISLKNQARLIDVVVSDEGEAVLGISLIWQVEKAPFLEDYQMELALVDSNGQRQSGWQAYQTQARYPTRAWEVGDIVRDEGWLPMAGLPAGDYQIQMRVLGKDGAVTEWQTIGSFTLSNIVRQVDRLALWRNGKIVHSPVLDYERETVQLVGDTADRIYLVDPNGASHQPVSAGKNWANFVIAPSWPAGDYFLPDSNVPLFQVAQSPRDFEIPPISHPLDADFAGNIKLLGYDLPSRRVEPGEGLTVMLYWQGLDWMGDEFVSFNRLLDNAQIVWGGRDRMAQENYSTLLWTPGEMVADPFVVVVDPNAPDGVYSLDVGWYHKIEGQAQSLPILNAETGESTGRSSVAIGPIKVGGPPADVTIIDPDPQNLLNTSLGDSIELLGFDMQQTAASLDLVFYWKALVQPPADYTVFVHIRSEADEIVAQKDSPPVGGIYPTSLWDSGEIIRDEVSVSVDGLEPGRYEVVAGMYDFATGQRLPLDGESEEVVLDIFEVVD